MNISQGIGYETGRAILRRVAWGAAMLVALVGAGFVFCGCGRQAEQKAVAASHSGAPSTQAEAASSIALGSVAETPAREPNSASLAAASVDSLSPEVAATVLDPVVYPGGSVEVTAEASADVEAVTLTDGRGIRTPFAYDSEKDEWRVAYRVPMRTASEHPALSVTAKNAAGRWSRVWVFLNVEKKGAATAAEPDTSARP